MTDDLMGSLPADLRDLTVDVAGRRLLEQLDWHIARHPEREAELRDAFNHIETFAVAHGPKEALTLTVSASIGDVQWLVINEPLVNIIGARRYPDTADLLALQVGVGIPDDLSGLTE